MGELTSLPNIGEKLENQLNNVGIFNFEQLKEIGSKEAWRRILETDSSACIMRLSALEGAIQGIRWHNLSDDVKTDLKAFYKANKSRL